MSDRMIGIVVAACVLGVVLLIVLGMWGCPQYNVWMREKAGQGELAQATWNRKIAVNEAEAKMEAAKMLAQAEIERAKGVAQANEIIGESLRNNEAYLRYLWVQGLADNPNKVIYVPTEANLPVLEATRLQVQEEKPTPAPAGR